MIAIVTVSAITFAACNESGDKKEKDAMSEKKSDTTKPTASDEPKDVKEITPTFASVDATMAGNLNKISMKTTHHHIFFALTIALISSFVLSSCKDREKATDSKKELWTCSMHPEIIRTMPVPARYAGWI